MIKTTKKKLSELDNLANKFIIGHKGYTDEQLEILEKIDFHKKKIINLRKLIRDQERYIDLYRDMMFSEK